MCRLRHLPSVFRLSFAWCPNIRPAPYCAQAKHRKKHEELDKFNDPDGIGIDELHYQMMQWDAFAQAWDEIIDDLREADMVSNKEVGKVTGRCGCRRARARRVNKWPQRCPTGTALSRARLGTSRAGCLCAWPASLVPPPLQQWDVPRAL